MMVPVLSLLCASLLETEAVAESRPNHALGLQVQFAELGVSYQYRITDAWLVGPALSYGIGVRLRALGWGNGERVGFNVGRAGLIAGYNDEGHLAMTIGAHWLGLFWLDRGADCDSPFLCEGDPWRQASSISLEPQVGWRYFKVGTRLDVAVVVDDAAPHPTLLWTPLVLTTTARW